MLKKDWLAIGFLLGMAVLITYWRLPLTFFQQDEWQAFGAYNYFNSFGGSGLRTLFPVASAMSHFTPFTGLLFRLEYFLFGTNFAPYAWLAIGCHLVNAILFFYFAYLLSKNKGLAAAAGLLFTVNSFSHQAVSWVAAGAGLLQATTFSLLALIFFPKSILLSLVFFFIALLFKETPLFLLFFLPFWGLILAPQKNPARLKKIIFPLFIFGLIYGLFRLVPILGKISTPQPEVVDISAPPLLAFFYRFLTVPLKALAQVFFPADWLVSWSEKLIFLAYPWFVGSDGAVNPYISQTVALDLLSYFLAFLIFFLVWLRFRSKTAIWGLAFVLIGSLPFILIPGRGGYFSIFEPRNLYLLGIGSALILASLASYKKWLVIFLLPLFIFHFQNIQKDLKKIQELGQLRKSFLVQIKEKYPRLPEKVVFYTESDTAYYGLPLEEKILPVQSGFGRMVMIWYQAQEQFPGCLYENQFLYPLIEQGYRECGGRGFGYFRDQEKLSQALADNQLSSENVIAFSWDSRNKEFKDITPQVKSDLRKLNNLN